LSILLAIAEPTISNGIRKVLVDHGFSVFEDEVLHRKFLNETIELLSPSMVIIHDHFLPSDFENPEERDEEILQMIENWRMVYDTDLRIVYLCVRDRYDPFLGKLVARNVLDIFYEKGLDTKKFAEQLSQPPRFANVQKFGTGHLDIKYVSEENEEDDDHVESEKPERKWLGEKKSLIEKAAKISSKVSFSAKKGTEGFKSKIPKRSDNPDEEDISDDNLMEEILDLLPDESVKQMKSTIIGTVLIAVAGVQNHLGSTSTALSIASYLKSLGHIVAVVEANHSQDFDRIHSLYEGEEQFFKNANSFKLYGITHYKYRENMDLNQLYSAYEYIIMDYGDLKNAAAYEEEFIRAHIRVVVCSADEWKFHWIGDFLKRHDLDKEDCIFVVPMATNAKLKDLQERLDYLEVFTIPSLDNPYAITKDTAEVLSEILGPYLKSSRRTFSKNALILTGVISIAATALIFTVFKFLG